MFKLIGGVVQLVRYTVSWITEATVQDSRIEEIEGENVVGTRTVIFDKVIEVEHEEPCCSEEEMLELTVSLRSEGVECTASEVLQEGHEWINGKEFGTVNEALTWYNEGEEAYLAFLASIPP